MPAPDDLTLLMQRLRTLQLRLNSVDSVAVREASERVLEWRSFAGDMKGAEHRRQLLQNHVTVSMKEVSDDFARRLEAEFIPRLDRSFQTLVPEVQSRAEAVTGLRMAELEDEFSGRLRALERYLSAADTQLTELTNASATAYESLAEFTDRMDQLWAEDNVESLGGWRTAITRIRAEKEASEKTSMEYFREEAFGDDDEADDPTAVGLICPTCRAPKGRRQPRAGVWEDLLGLVSIAPYYCSRCMVRFYRFRPKRRKKRAAKD